MKNQEIVAIVQSYMAQRRSGEGGVKLPAAVAWKRRLNMDELCRLNDVIYAAVNEVTAPFFDEEHAEIDENGQRTVKPEYLPDFVKAQAEILEQETEVKIRRVSIEDLGSIELSDADMDTLAFMLEGGE